MVEVRRVGILSPGDMGAGIGLALRQSGLDVLTQSIEGLGQVIVSFGQVRLGGQRAPISSGGVLRNILAGVGVA